MNDAESRSGQVVRVQQGFEFLGINPLGGEDAERQGVANPHLDKAVEFPAQAAGRIVFGGIRRRNVGRRQNPGQTGVGVQHIARPPLHRDHGQFAFDVGLVPFLVAVHPLFIDHLRQFPYRQPVEIRNFILADKREPGLFHQAAFHFQSPLRIGPVEHHYFNAQFPAGAHRQPQGADEGIGTGAHVLDIIDHHIDALEHLRRRFAGRSVQRIDGQASFLVYAVRHLSACIDIAAHPVFRAVKRHQIHFGSLLQYLDGGHQLAVHPAGIGQQAHAFAFENVKSPVPEYFHPRFDRSGRLQGQQREQQKKRSFHFPNFSSIGRRAAKVTPTVHRQQTITITKKPG